MYCHPPASCSLDTPRQDLNQNRRGKQGETIGMKVAQITSSYIGAQRKIIDSIKDEMTWQGSCCRVFYFNKIKTQDHDCSAVCLNSQFTYFCFRVLRKLLGKHYWLSWYQTRRLIDELDRYRPSVVHLHVIHNGAIDFVQLLKYLADKSIKVIWTMHDMWAFTGGCYHYSESKCKQFESGCQHCPRDKAALDNSPSQTNKLWLRKRTLIENLKAIRFVAVSTWVASEMKKSFLQDYQIRVVYNGVTENKSSTNSDFVSRKLSKWIKPGKRILVAVANGWGESKGLSRAFELAAMLEEDYALVLVGSYYGRTDKLPSNVVSWGYDACPGNLGALYSVADFHVSFSLEETFGMTFVEAALCGTRSIAFDSTAIGEIVRSVFGYTVPPGDVLGMAKTIRRTQTNQLALKLMKEQVAHVRESYSEKRMSMEYMGEYRALMAEA